MTFNPFDFTSLNEMLTKNKNLLENFFGNNPFDESFLNQISKNGKIIDQENSTSEISDRQIPYDLIQRNNELVIIFEIPGLNSEEDVDIKILGSALIVEGEIKRNYILADKELVKFERKIGRFSRKVTLPVIFDHKRIKAKYNHGLLEVRIPILKSNNYEKVLVKF